MSIDPREKVVLFIDGANLYATSKAIGIDIDYRRLLAEFQSKAYLLRAYYYTALVEDQEYSSIRPLIDWLDYNGFTVVTKPAKEFTDAAGRRKIKGSMDIELTVDALEMSPHFDHFVLFSGDGDFTALVAALQRTGQARDGRLDADHLDADDLGRSAPAGGLLPRGRRARQDRRARASAGAREHGGAAGRCSGRAPVRLSRA